MLAGGNGLPTVAQGWLFEPKWDGVRVIVGVAPGSVRVWARKGNDVTAAYPELAALAGSAADHAMVLDGELVAFDPAGHPSFQVLQRRMHVRHPSAGLQAEVPVMLVAFDLLWFDGELLTGRPQSERRTRLEHLELGGPSWRTCPTLAGLDRHSLLDACREAGLEGYMAKRADAVYQAGRRSPAWAKVKCGRRREFVVGGWTEGKAGRTGDIGSLAVGYVTGAPEDAAAADLQAQPSLRYVGQVGSGLSGDMLAELRRVFSRFASDRSPFLNTPRSLRLHFVQPVLVVEVAFHEVTSAGTLRQPSIKGFRADVVPAEVVWDPELRPIPPP